MHELSCKINSFLVASHKVYCLQVAVTDIAPLLRLETNVLTTGVQANKMQVQSDSGIGWVVVVVGLMGAWQRLEGPLFAVFSGERLYADFLTDTWASICGVVLSSTHLSPSPFPLSSHP